MSISTTSRRFGALFFAFALAVGAAACGDDDDPTTQAGSDSSASQPATGSTSSGGAGGLDCGLANGEKASGEPIKVGAVVGATGPADFSSASKGAAAFFDCVNENGGIDGQPVEYLVEDDGWDDAQATQVARQLVEDEDVVAMIGSTSFVECRVNAGYYEQQDVLVIAGVGVPRECFHSRNIAPTNQGPRLSGIGVAEYAREQGAQKMACIANNIPNFGGWVCEGLEAWGAENNVEVASFGGQPDASDAETVVTQALATEPDSVVVVDAAPAMVAYLKVAEQQAPEIDWYAPTSAYDLTFPDAVGDFWNDRLNVQIELAPLDSTGPDNTLWTSVMDTYAADDDPRDSFSQAGFLAAKIFTDTLLDLDATDLDRATVSEALRGIDDYETDLLCGPWYFGEAQDHTPNHAGRIVRQVADGIRFETIKECFEVPDPDLDAILAAEAN
ncbi:MAG: ABC transporter substrate-binding protein [Acidimicrobiia bacterium]